MGRYTFDHVLAAAIGARIREARTSAGVSQTEVAAQIALSGPGQISRWERGEQLPSLDSLVRVAMLLGVDPGELLPDEREARKIFKR